MNQSLVIGSLLAALSVAGSAAALDVFPWRNHATPLSFIFGNEIDGHQQSQLAPNGTLGGFLYISFTGVTTSDGYRVAAHTDCAATKNCTVGWTFQGKPRTGTFLYHEMEDHPVFLLDRGDIPQPGAFSHFHRVGSDPESSGPGYVLSLLAIDSFCFIHHGAENAVRSKSCAENGGVAISPGFDTASHLNIVTSAPPQAVAGGG